MNVFKKRIVLFSSLVIIIIASLFATTLLLNSKHKASNNDKPDSLISDNKIIQDVSPNKAEEMYDELTEKCTGVLIWDLKPGNEVTIDKLDNTNACKKDDHYSKMIGYTYDKDKNVIIHVNVLKKQESKLYKLDSTFVGEFKEENLSDLLDLGTTYKYTYQKNNNNYKLTKVELM